MATTEMDLNTDAAQVDYRQASRPLNYEQTWVVDDGDNHDFFVRAAGKGRMTVCLDVSTSDQTVTATVYGAHDPEVDPGGEGVAQIGSFTITDAEDIDYVTVNDPFPFYIIRAAAGAGATGDPTCTIYVNFSAF